MGLFLENDIQLCKWGCFWKMTFNYDNGIVFRNVNRAVLENDI
jgi:hypothetical protein